MAEERRAERAGYKADGVDAERLQRSDQRVGRGEIQFRENQRGNEHVEQEIIRLDHRADGRGDNGAAQLHAVLSIGQVFGRNPGCRHRVSPRDVHSRRPEPSWALYGRNTVTAAVREQEPPGSSIAIETTTNDVSAFKHYRKVEHREGPATRALAPSERPSTASRTCVRSC